MIKNGELDIGSPMGSIALSLLHGHEWWWGWVCSFFPGDIVCSRFFCLVLHTAKLCPWPDVGITLL